MKVINAKNLPVRFPFFPTLVIFMADEIKMFNDYVMGALYLIMLAVWIAVFYKAFKEEKVDIFDK